MFEYDEATWDGVHLPATDKRYNTRLMIAKPGDTTPLEGDGNGFGCPRDVYVAVWVDLTGQSGLQELLAGRTVMENRKDLMPQFAALAPGSGDLFGVAGPLQFGKADNDCGTLDQTTAVSIAAVP
jgi:hypothetical protein